MRVWGERDRRWRTAEWLPGKTFAESTRTVNVGIVGAGPGGLFLARLLRRAAPHIDVHIYERNPRDRTSGFGVVFADRALPGIQQVDPDVHAELLARGVRWDPMELRHRGATVRWRGFGMAAISRRRLIDLLVEAADDAGATLRFETPVSDADLLGHDLVVGADGVGSAVRSAHRDVLRPDEHVGEARYIWLGTDAPFTEMTFAFKRNEHGAFAVHAYPYGNGESTFLVETDEVTWCRAGFADGARASTQQDGSDEGARSYLEDLFRKELGGGTLRSDHSYWLRFRTIRTGAWSDGRVVLMGDAAHTAHFSLGSGTRMAMEDAISLARALADTRPANVSQALAAYERERRPAVERLQTVAEHSRRWWETFRYRLDLAPARLAVNYVSRTGKVGVERLTQFDEALVEAAASELVGEPTSVPYGLRTPFRKGGLDLAGRVVLERRLCLPPGKDVAAEHRGSELCAQASLVIFDVCAAVDDDDVSALVSATHAAGRAIGLRVSPARAAKLGPLDLGSLEYLEMCVGEEQGDTPGTPPASRTVAMGVAIASRPWIDVATLDRLFTLVRETADLGYSFVNIVIDHRSPAHQHMAKTLAERVRLELGLSVILGPFDGTDPAATAILAGRCDLVSTRHSCGRCRTEPGSARAGKSR